MMRHRRAYAIALAVGMVLVWAVPALVTLVAGLPGLGGVLRTMQAAGIPLGLYPVFAIYLPMFLLAFAVGAALRRYLEGCGVGQLLACGAPWIVVAAGMLAWIYAGTGARWLGEIPGVAVVPVALLLASFVPPRPGREPGMALAAAASAATAPGPAP